MNGPSVCSWAALAEDLILLFALLPLRIRSTKKSESSKRKIETQLFFIVFTQGYSNIEKV